MSRHRLFDDFTPSQQEQAACTGHRIPRGGGAYAGVNSPAVHWGQLLPLGIGMSDMSAPSQKRLAQRRKSVLRSERGMGIAHSVREGGP